jgi:hypothetical protein
VLLATVGAQHAIASSSDEHCDGDAFDADHVVDARGTADRAKSTGGREPTAAPALPHGSDDTTTTANDVGPEPPHKTTPFPTTPDARAETKQMSRALLFPAVRALATAGFDQAAIATADNAASELDAALTTTEGWAVRGVVQLLASAARADRDATKGLFARRGSTPSEDTAARSRVTRLFQEAGRLYDEAAAGAATLAASARTSQVVAEGSAVDELARTAHLRLGAVYFRHGMCGNAHEVLTQWVDGRRHGGDVDAVVALAMVLMDCPRWPRDRSDDENDDSTDTSPSTLSRSARWRRAATLLSDVVRTTDATPDGRAFLLLGRVRARPPPGAADIGDDEESVALLQR